MAYTHLESGLIWLSQRDSMSLSGCKTDFIYGSLGIGSPHGHIVLWNGSICYKREVFDWNSRMVGSQLFV